MYEKQIGTMPGGQPTGRREIAEMAGSAAVEQRALLVTCDQLEKSLAAIAEGVSRVNLFKERLLNPRPAKIAKDGSNMAHGSTLEGRLQHLLHIATEISDALHSAAQELERAA